MINKDAMEVIAPFNLKSVEDMREGQKASVLLTDTFETIEGYVTKISESSTALEGGGFAYSVTIEIENNITILTRFKKSIKCLF